MVAGCPHEEQISDGEVGKIDNLSGARSVERGELEPRQQLQVRERAEADMLSLSLSLSLSSRVIRVVCSSLELTQMQTQALSMPPSCGVTLALGKDRGPR